MDTKKILFNLFLLCVSLNIGNTQTLVINEFMADNGELTEILDEAGQADDWIEIHNTTNTTIDMAGYFLSDKGDDLQKWEVPSNQPIGPYGYKIFWADDDASQGERHTTFKLSKSGESIYISDPSGVVLDSVEYGEQTTNISYARIPNGTGDFEFKAPTFRYNNEATSNVGSPLNKAAFSIFPNPAIDFFTVEWKEAKADLTLNVSIWDALGQLMHNEQVSRAGEETKAEISLQQYASGLYYVQLETEEYHWMEVLVVE